MVAFTSFAFAATALLGLAAAAPGTPPPTGVIHRVKAGFSGGLLFEPENIVAQPGDLVEVHFLPKNHSFAQSSFDKPCEPINENAFFSGFQPTTEGEAPQVFSISVVDDKPLWFYCGQTKGNHCQMGMAGVINQNFDGPNTLAAYKEKAKTTGPSTVPPQVQGGFLGPNMGMD